MANSTITSMTLVRGRTLKLLLVMHIFNDDRHKDTSMWITRHRVDSVPGVFERQTGRKQGFCKLFHL